VSATSGRPTELAKLKNEPVKARTKAKGMPQLAARTWRSRAETRRRPGRSATKRSRIRWRCMSTPETTAAIIVRPRMPVTIRPQGLGM